MAEYTSISFIIWVFLILGILAEKRNYHMMSMDSSAICNPIDKIGSIDDLRQHKNYAMYVYPGHVFDSWIVLSNKHCKFKVKAPKGEGLFAVVQKMVLRRNGSECLDYIRFQLENEPFTEKFCGKYIVSKFYQYSKTVESQKYGMQSSNDENDPENFLDVSKKYEKFSRQGKITTEIFISKQPLNPGESLNLVLTFTPYKVCKSDENERSQWKNLPNSNICINSKYVCDSYVNCASSLCFDEYNCSNITEHTINNEHQANVIVTAVTSMFLCFIIFIMCLYICRKHEKLCWSPDCAGPSNTISGSVSGIPMDRGDQSIGNQPYVPAAPMLEVAVPSVHDKDLPPSYDSLFPPQTSAAST